MKWLNYIEFIRMEPSPRFCLCVLDALFVYIIIIIMILIIFCNLI